MSSELGFDCDTEYNKICKMRKTDKLSSSSMKEILRHNRDPVIILCLLRRLKIANLEKISRSPRYSVMERLGSHVILSTKDGVCDTTKLFADTEKMRDDIKDWYNNNYEDGRDHYLRCLRSEISNHMRFTPYYRDRLVMEVMVYVNSIIR